MSGRSCRRRYFVQPRLQGRFIALFGVLTLLGALASAIATGTLAHQALDEAMFRAHFAERSTTDILLPVLLRVNGVAAAAMIACGLLAATWVFARQSRTVDALCARMASWKARQEQGTGAPEPPLSGGWATDLEVALSDAEGALRATYRSAAAQASGLASAAERLESTLGSEHSDEALATVGERLERTAAALARCQTEERA